MQAGLALYWWHRLITYGVGRIRVNIQNISKVKIIPHPETDMYKYLYN